MVLACHTRIPASDYTQDRERKDRGVACWGEGNSRERKMELKIQEGSRKGGKRGGRRGGEEEEEKEETVKEADMEETDFKIVL